MSKKNILTQEGYQSLKKKLSILLRERRKTVVDMEEARGMGDLAENTAYHTLRNQLLIVDNQISGIKEILENAQIVKADRNGGGISIGSKVKVVQEGREKVLEIVGDGEANPLAGKISLSSPLAQSLLGKKSGENIEVSTPVGSKVIRILAVE